MGPMVMRGPGEPIWGKITQTTARAAALASLPWQDSSSPSDPELDEGKGVPLAAGGSPSSSCEVGSMATVEGPDQGQTPQRPPARKGNSSPSSPSLGMTTMVRPTGSLGKYAQMGIYEAQWV